jgi:pimeloyl-ACP methyl ester carboxylesterase
VTQVAQPASNPSAPREGRAVVDGGTRLWYRRAGKGPALVFQNGLGVTITFWEAMAARFAEKGYTTVIWDYRGHGQSDPPRDPAAMSLETCVEDLLAILDENGIERACLLGHSMGSQLDFEFYRRYPARVTGLVPTLGTYRKALSTFWSRPRAAELVYTVARFGALEFPRLAHFFTGLAAAHPHLSDALVRKLNIVHPTLSPKEWLPPYLEHMASLDLRVFFALAAAIKDHDASDLLPRIEVPTLVIAGDRDFFCPPKVAREMAEKIPGAELLLVPGGSHAATIEQPELIDLRLERFLEERVYPGR